MQVVLGIWKTSWRRIMYLIYKYQKDDVGSLAAEMSYYFILAFFPFLIFMLTLVSYTPFSSEWILQKIKPLLEKEFYQIVASYVRDFFNNKQGTLLSFSIIGTVWAISSGVLALMKGLNIAYEIREERPYWKVRSISILITLGLASIILLTLILLVFGDRFGQLLMLYFGNNEMFVSSWNVIQYFIPILAMLIVFMWIYWVVPNRNISIHQVIPGAIYCTGGWLVSSVVFAFYVNMWDSFSSYGSIGGALVLLVWIYITSVHLLIGGQINAMLVNKGLARIDKKE